MESSGSEFCYHTDCSNCGSSDAGSIYSDGHFYCHRCGHYEPGEGEVQSTHRNMAHVEIKGEAVRLAKRGIRAETCRKYQCFKDGELLRFYYKDRAGSTVGAKVKTIDKEFSWEGSNKDKLLYGQWLWSNGGKSSDKFEKKVVITEGELDAMSVHEIFPNWPVVSLPNGAAAAKKAIQAQLEWLQEFEYVILFFDNDEAGRQALEEAAAVLPTGKVKIARLDPRFKDASDALQSNDSKAISSAVWNAEVWTPGGIVAGRDLLQIVTTPNPACVYEYPWRGLNEKTHGIRFGELVTFTAGSGIGKSSVCRELAVHLLNNGATVGYLALEESNQRTAKGLMSVHDGKPYHIGDHTAEELKAAFDRSMANWDIYFFDGFGSYDPELIYKKIEYLALGLDCKIIFLDHLSILLSGLDGDERRMIDVTMTKLRSLVERTGITLFLVSHLKRTSGDQNHEEGARVTLGQLRGSAAIAQLSDTVIALERNQQDDEGTTVRVLKNRLTGEVGPACTLQYSLASCRYRELESEPLFSAYDESTSDF